MGHVKSLAEISSIVLSSINQLHIIPKIGNIIQPLFERSLVQYVAFATRQPTPHRFPVAILHGRYYYFAYHCFRCTYIPAVLCV